MKPEPTPDEKRDAGGATTIALGTGLGAAFGDVAVGVAIETGLGAAAYSLYAVRSGRG